MAPTPADWKDLVTRGAVKQRVRAGELGARGWSVLVLLGVPAELSPVVRRVGNGSANTGVSIPVSSWFG